MVLVVVVGCVRLAVLLELFWPGLGGSGGRLEVVCWWRRWWEEGSSERYGGGDRPVDMSLSQAGRESDVDDVLEEARSGVRNVYRVQREGSVMKLWRFI
jgi:hypothetical protein